jgi:hypothetical protein
MHDHIGVSIWESRLTLGNHTFAGTIEEFGTRDSSQKRFGISTLSTAGIPNTKSYGRQVE